MSIFLLSQTCEAVKLVISSARALQTPGVSAALMQVRVLALLLGNCLVDFAQAIADHIDWILC
jgi:hypothetical protein